MHYKVFDATGPTHFTLLRKIMLGTFERRYANSICITTPPYGRLPVGKGHSAEELSDDFVLGFRASMTDFAL